MSTDLATNHISIEIKVLEQCQNTDIFKKNHLKITSR